MAGEAAHLPSDFHVSGLSKRMTAARCKMIVQRSSKDHFDILAMTFMARSQEKTMVRFYFGIIGLVLLAIIGLSYVLDSIFAGVMCASLVGVTVLGLSSSMAGSRP
jgi:hypothetical protein